MFFPHDQVVRVDACTVKGVLNEDGGGGHGSSLMSKGLVAVTLGSILTVTVALISEHAIGP